MHSEGETYGLLYSSGDEGCGGNLRSSSEGLSETPPDDGPTWAALDDEPAGTLYATAALDTDAGLDESYHPALLEPTPEMLEARLATERPDHIHTSLDAVARLGLVSGTELNAVYREAVQRIADTGVCPDRTLNLLRTDVLRYPMYRAMAPVKRAVVLYALWLFPEMQLAWAAGNSGSGVRHEPVDAEAMTAWVEGPLTDAIDPLRKCIATPHQFVDRAMASVEEGGVHGYLLRSLHA